MYYSIQYSTQVEHTVGVAARVSPRRKQYVVVVVVVRVVVNVPPSTGTLAMAFADKSIRMKWKGCVERGTRLPALQDFYTAQGGFTGFLYTSYLQGTDKDFF